MQERKGRGDEAYTLIPNTISKMQYSEKKAS